MTHKDRTHSFAWGVAAVMLAIAVVGCSQGSASSGSAKKAEQESSEAASKEAERAGPFDLDGEPVDPFAPLKENQALAFVFVTVDCPIANRYAPTVLDLYEAFHPKGIGFTVVYTDPNGPVPEIRKHKKDYGYPFRAIRDPNHALVRHAEVDVTPEVAVYAARDKLLYRGRINNRFVDFGKTRARATRHDLKRALEAIVADRSIETRRTEAVGCYIPDPKP